jgi:hypothetical protein
MYIPSIRFSCFVLPFIAVILGVAFLFDGRALKMRSMDGTSVAFGKLPLSFEPNNGQTAGPVKFVSRGEGYTFFLTAHETLLLLKKSDGQGAVVRMRLENAHPAPSVRAENQQAGESNYFIGDDPSKWLTEIPHYAQVRYQDVYPGIDQLFYGNDRQLEYDFIVAPGSDPAQIALRIGGVDRTHVDQSGELVMSVSNGELRQLRPVIYQEINGERKHVEGRYIVSANDTVGFEIGKYDPGMPLIIDPVLVFSTYLGGNAADAGRGIAIDGQRNTYITGSTSATNFPTANAIQPNNAGNGDIFVTKINSAGTAIVYSTYIGGNAGEIGHGIDVDAAGNAYVTGVTGGTLGPNNFPTTPGAFDSTFNTPDEAVLLKISAAGSGLLYSTYTGASIAFDVKVDKNTGEAFIAGNAGSMLPTTPGAFRESCKPAPCFGNGFITKFNATGSALVYSTYIGPGIANDIAIDASGSAYVTGSTLSTVFPITPGAAQPTCTGCNLARSDAFVMRMNPTGSALIYSTYLGGSIDEVGTSIAVDQNQNAYVTGRTESSIASMVPFPTTPGAFQTTAQGIPDGFVTKVNPMGTTFLYSTYLGGNVRDEPFGIAVDREGKTHIIGQTRSNNFPKVAAIQDLCTINGACVFITTLNSAGSAVIFSTYFGQGSGWDIVADTVGSIYVTGEVYEGLTNVPLMNPIQATPGGGLSVQDGFVAKIFVAALKAGPFDFDGDGKTDIGIFRPNAFLSEWWINRSSDGQTFALQFGASTDPIVPADYTGDGKTDIAFYRPISGEWYVLRSEDFSFFSLPFGVSSDIPVPADYDADGKADFAVYRPSSSTWFISQSSGAPTQFVQFGLTGDVPVVADYDGDGKADIAIFRQTAGGAEWWIQRSTAGSLALQFGNSTDKPVQGDYTGDGKADVAVWRPATGEWFVVRSEDSSFYGFPFGTNGDVVAPGDYDGDGKFDPTLFRPSNSTWFIARTTAGTQIVHFGTTGDRPLPNAFVP